MTKTLERKIIETAERDISKTSGDVDMAIKKYVIFIYDFNELNAV